MGTVCKLSLVNGTAFIDAVGLDLTPYHGTNTGFTPYAISVTDSAAKVAAGFIGASGLGETLSATEKIVNGTFAAWTGDNPDSWTVVNENAANYVTENPAGVANIVSDLSAAITLLQNFAGTAGALYKFVFTIGGAIVGWRFITTDGEIPLGDRTSVGLHNWYFTAKDITPGINWYRQAGGPSNYTIDNVSVKQVTEPAATGVHIVSAKNGTTRNWASIDGLFNWNDPAGYTVAVTQDLSGYTWYPAWRTNKIIMRMMLEAYRRKQLCR